jgi:ABC-type amino acid transport substrate-binding protein
VTPEREEIVDFTHPFHTSGLGIAVAPRKGRWLAVLRRFFSWTFLKVAAGLIVILLVAGTVVWFFERRRNPEQFGGGIGKGLGAGFWWSAVTVTTVGYGDKAPKTAAGRAVALIWMFMGIVLISGFTAALASVLTTAKLESPVRGPENLPGVRVSTVAGTTSENYLRDQHIRFRAYQSPEEALNSVAAGKADAAVYDAPILRHLVTQRNDTALQVLHRKFERQDYGFALPSGSALREPINRVLLRTIGDPAWQDTLYKYLGA